MKEKEIVRVVGVDSIKKSKALFVLRCKGKTLSTAVREMIDELAKECDETKE